VSLFGFAGLLQLGAKLVEFLTKFVQLGAGRLFDILPDAEGDGCPEEESEEGDQGNVFHRPNLPARQESVRGGGSGVTATPRCPVVRVASLPLVVVLRAPVHENCDEHNHNEHHHPYGVRHFHLYVKRGASIYAGAQGPR